MNASVRIPERLASELVDLARAGLPNEVCGVIGGVGTRFERLYPLANVSASPERYTVDALEQMDAYRSMERDDLECVAVYHSHPTSPAQPSATDIAEAYDPDTAYVIVSLEADPDLRAFRIKNGTTHCLTIDLMEE